MSKQQMKGWVQLAEDAVDSGTTLAEDLHRSIAARPFELLSRFGVSAPSLDRLREAQDDLIAQSYDTVRTTAVSVGGLVRGLIDRAEKQEQPTE